MVSLSLQSGTKKGQEVPRAFLIPLPQKLTCPLAQAYQLCLYQMKHFQFNVSNSWIPIPWVPQAFLSALLTPLPTKTQDVLKRTMHPLPLQSSCFWAGNTTGWYKCELHLHSDSLTVTKKVSVYPLQFSPGLHLTEQLLPSLNIYLLIADLWPPVLLLSSSVPSLSCSSMSPLDDA